MVELKTAEGTTKHLRSKGILPQEAVATADALLSGSLDVFLLNKHHFVFDLICDRMNEFTGKDFKSWKLEPLLWRLWSTVWHLMGLLPLDLDARSRSFRRVKLVSIMTSVIEQADAEALDAMFACVGEFLVSGYIEADEYTVTGLLGAYAEWLEKHTTETVNNWTPVVIQLFELPRQSSNYKPTKKSTARYFANVLPHLLNFLSSDVDASLKPTVELLARQNRTFLFDVESAKTLCSHMDDVTAHESLTDAAVEYLFHEVIRNLAATDIASCESVFVSITKNEQFSQLSEKLLHFLAKVNRALSTDFFEQLYATEMTRQPIRWGLVGHIISLSPELAQKKTDDIIKASESLSAEDIKIVASSLAQGYILARDFDKFIGEVYPRALEANSAWSSDDVLDHLASKCDELSGNQIATLILEALKCSEKKKVVLLLMGLLRCSVSKQEASFKAFSDESYLQKGWSEVVYYLLCIYGDEIKLDGILKRVVPDGPSTKYDFFLTFRVVELTGDVGALKEKKIEKFVKKLGTNEAFAYAKRWLVLMDLFDSINTALLQKLVEGSSEQFLNFFTTEATLIYELPGFLTSLASFIVKNPKFPYTKNLFCMMPSTIYRKFFSSFTDKLCRDALKDEEAKIILRHVYEDANGSSILEKDLDFFKRFTASDNSELTTQVSQLIWNGHITRFKDSASADFANNALKHLLKSLKKKPAAADIRLSQVVLNGKRPKNADFQASLGALCDAYVNFVTKNKDIPEEEINVLANLPSPLSDKVRALLKALLKAAGNKDLGTPTKSSLFVLATKTSTTDLHGALFLCSLYLALQLDSPRLIDSLSAFFKTLSQEDFYELYLHLLASCEDANPPYLDATVRLLSTLAHHLDKTHQKEHSKLFVSTILVISLRIEDIEEKQTIIGFLSALTVMLSDHVWIVSQYSIELILATVGLVFKKSQHRDSSTVFIAAIGLVSYIVLFHRFRLTSRYHLLVAILVEAMKHLTRKDVTNEDASVFGRILVTLSEPPIQRSTKESDSLTSQSAIYKRAIRRQAHVLLINYVHMQVSAPLNSSVTDALMPGIYSVFGLLSKVELQLVNQLLDLLGKVYFKNLYQSFKDHGKWKN